MPCPPIRRRGVSLALAAAAWPAWAGAAPAATRAAAGPPAPTAKSAAAAASGGLPGPAAQDAADAEPPPAGPPAAPGPRWDAPSSRQLRDWITVLIHAQLQQGPSPRWTHRDCAGLVRFAVAESLRPHDLAWRRSMGLLGQRLPPDLDPQLSASLRHRWRRADGSQGAFVSALELVQANSRLVGRQLAQAQTADLLFYDFGDDQHLMVWMGRYIAYHTGRVAAGDSGLRALPAAQLMAWTDTRWRPATDNPNFVGLYRLAFIA